MSENMRILAESVLRDHPQMEYRGEALVMPVRCDCEACRVARKVVAVPEGVIDFAEFRPLLEELLEEIKVSIKGTGEKPGRGDWSDYSEEKVFDAVAEEFDEFREAYVRGDLVGEHGQIAELLDVAVTALKGVRRLREVEQCER